MSDQASFEVLKFKITVDILEVQQKNIADKIEQSSVKSDYLKNKMFKWKLMQKVKKNFINESEVLSDLRINEKPLTNYANYCKVSCRECKQDCLFRLGEINDMPVSQTEINEELKRHGHPKSRQRNGRNRSLAEAKTELKNHYLEYHFYRLS